MSDLPSPLIVRCHDAVSPEDVASQIGRLDGDDLLRATFLVIITGQQSATDLCGEKSRQVLRGRLPALPMRVLYFDRVVGDHRILDVDTGQVPGDAAGALASIRSTELAGVVRQGSAYCYFSSAGHYHFIAPSGYHCRAFIRVGDSFRTSAALEILAYWLLPSLFGVDVVVGDTWSFSPVLFRAVAILGREIPVECFGTHPAVAGADGKELLRRVSERLKSGQTLAFVVSAAGSGAVAKFVSDVCKESLPEGAHVRTTILYGVANKCGGDPLCQVAAAEEPAHSPESCPDCRANSIPLRIDPALYYVKDIVERTVILKRKYFNRDTRNFLRLAAKTQGVLSVHRDHPHDKRHLAFYVDIERLLIDKRAKRKLADHLKGVSWDEVLIPEHAAGDALASIVKGVTGIDALRINDLASVGRRSSLSRRLRAARRLLILDDAIVTGSRLRRYNNELRLRWPNKSVVLKFLVMIDRAESPEVLNDLRQSVLTNSPFQVTLDAIWTLRLPGWKDRECPWCHEYDWLDRLVQSGGAHEEWIEERLAHLTDRQSGIVHDPLLRRRGTAAAVTGRGALAGKGLSEMQTVFSLAAAVQALRCEQDGGRLSRDYPVSQVLAGRNFTSYSESLIRGALLRALQPGEFSLKDLSKLAPVIQASIDDPSQSYTVGEVLAALDRRILDRAVAGPALGSAAVSFPGWV